MVLWEAAPEIPAQAALFTGVFDGLEKIVMKL
jgi:hypothetical protein